MSTIDISRVPKQWPNRQYSQSLFCDGMDWHFQFCKNQDPQAKLLVLIHGTGSSSHSWHKIFPALAKNYTVIAVDLPGHGFTLGAQKSQLDVLHMAKSLKNLFQTLKLPSPYAIIGHSAGANCALALNLLTKTPAKIIGLNPSLVPLPNFYNNFLGPLLHPIATSGFMASFLASSISITGVIDTLLDSTNSKLSEEQRKLYRLLFKEQSHVYGSMNFMVSSHISELLSNSSKIKTQHTFLVAAQDPWVPQLTLLPAIQKFFPKAIVKIEDGGHLFHEVNPTRTLEIVFEALQSTQSSTTPSYA